MKLTLFLLVLVNPNGVRTSTVERGKDKAEALASYYAEAFGVSVTIEEM